MKIIIFFITVSLSLNLTSQTTDWVMACGGPNSDKGISIGTDSLGFIYISGFYNGDADFGPFHLTASYTKNKNIFVAKMDSLGNFLWAVAGTGGPFDDRALGMHVTPAGDVFLTGTFWSYVEFPSSTGPVSNPTSNVADNSMLIKIDKDGDCEFVISIIDNNNGDSGNCWGTGPGIYSSDDHSYDVKVDDDGFIYVTGFFSGDDAVFLGGITLNNPNWVNCQPQGYIGKLDPSGNWLWVDNFDGIKDQRGSRDNRLEIDQFSNIYVVGGFQGTGTYGPYSITSNGEWDAFIFKMDKDGNWLWAKNVGSNKTDRANSIAIDLDDDIYITGEYRNPMVFTGANASNGTDTLSHKQKRDIFVAKCNNNGDWIWAKRARSTGTDKPYQMSVDANKQVFVCGTMGDIAKFSNDLTVIPPNANDTNSAWVAQLDGASNNGDWVWAKMGGSDRAGNRTGGICPDGFGNVYAVGFFEGLANFDGTVLDATNRKKDIFVWKICLNINNTYDTIYTADSMVFNTIDTGIFVSQTYTVTGCDTNFVNTIVHQKLGVQINYNINNPGTATFSINGVVQAMPYSQNYWAGETISIVATLQPNWAFSKWRAYSNIVLPNANSITASFVASTSDSCVLVIYLTPPLAAFIAGDEIVCDNSKEDAEVEVSFISGVPPYSFVYAINGVTQPAIITYDNPHYIKTKLAGVYTLQSFSDITNIGSVNGSAMVTVQQSPIALFTSETDTLSILYPTVQLNDATLGNIVAWQWNFGDNSANDFSQNPFHTYSDSMGIYQLSLIVIDALGCRDTTFKQLWIADEYWMYIPNSFTPDHDGVNDVFCLAHHGIREATFHFNIYDRFSNLVFVTENISELECFLNSNENGWDGKHYKTGNDLPMGTYVYEVYFQDFEGWKHQDMGNLFIIR